MFKATAGQRVGAHILLGTDGTNVTTGTCTVYLTKDGGAQAVGNVSGGACTHKGNGYWQYVADATDTNADFIAFTFVHSTGVDATVQIETEDKDAADKLSASAKALVTGVVGSTAGNSTTVIQLTGGSGAISPAVATNALKGRIILFRSDTPTTAALRGQGAPIDSNTSTTITIASGNALTTAPAHLDTFVIA